MVVEEEKKNFGEKALSTGYKIGGWHYRLKAISSFILGAILIIVGVVLSMFIGSLKGLIISVIGLFSLLGGWFYWRRAKSLVRGRFY